MSTSITLSCCCAGPLWLEDDSASLSEDRTVVKKINILSYNQHVKKKLMNLLKVFWVSSASSNQIDGKDGMTV
jgi:hypothetical protein